MVCLACHLLEDLSIGLQGGILLESCTKFLRGWPQAGVLLDRFGLLMLRKDILATEGVTVEGFTRGNSFRTDDENFFF